MSNTHFSAKIINHSHGQGTTSLEDIQQRAGELARIDGRRADEFTDSDLETARFELMGGHGEEIESDCYVIGADSVAGSMGHHIPNISGDESENAVTELVMEGMEEAEHDQMLAASALNEPDDL